MIARGEGAGDVQMGEGGNMGGTGLHLWMGKSQG